MTDAERPLDPATEDVQLQIMSDLHLETPRYLPMYEDFTITPRCPFLALLGDIGSAHDARLFSFLESQLLKFKIVFYVLGNHEPYMPETHDPDGDDPSTAYTYEAAVSIMERFEDANNAAALAGNDQTTGEEQATPKPGQFVFLNRRRFDLSDTVTVLGATLFSRIADDQRRTTSFSVSDFSNVQNWSVDAHNAAHEADLAWLNGQVEAMSRESELCHGQGRESDRDGDAASTGSRGAKGRSVVILTHHSPTCSPRANDPGHLDDDRGVLTAFATDLASEPCWTAPCVKAWAFGHTHFNCDYVDGGGGSTGARKRVVANQRGYGREDAFDFDPDKVITVE